MTSERYKDRLAVYTEARKQGCEVCGKKDVTEDGVAPYPKDEYRGLTLALVIYGEDTTPDDVRQALTQHMMLCSTCYVRLELDPESPIHQRFEQTVRCMAWMKCFKDSRGRNVEGPEDLRIPDSFTEENYPSYFEDERNLRRRTLTALENRRTRW